MTGGLELLRRTGDIYGPACISESDASSMPSEWIAECSIFAIEVIKQDLKRTL